MKTEFYRPVADTSIIKSALIDFYDQNAGLNDSDIYIERSTVTPNPNTIIADSDYGFETAIDLIYDN